MKPERQIERFLKRINVIPDAERKRVRLDALLAVGDKSQESTSAHRQPTIRRFIMDGRIWRVAAALVFVATVVGVIGILQNGGQTAYAFEQTVAAMQGKRSFHILTYWGSPTERKDEFWAEFDERGQVVRCRQVEWWGRGDLPVEVLWENQIKHQYEPRERGPGVLVISQTKQHVDEDMLEEFDPEKIMEGIGSQLDDGEATIEVGETLTAEGYFVVEVTEQRRQWLRVLLVDPETDLVLRIDTYNLDDEDGEDEEDEDDDDDEGSDGYIYGIEVLEYNQPFDPKLFEPDFAEDTIIVDQLSRVVGMAQGDLGDEAVASRLIRQALEAWAADDYETAGLLFGGAPKAFFTHNAWKKPIGDIVVGGPEVCMIEAGRMRFRIICDYAVDRGGELETTREYYFVTTVAGQPGRWFVTPIKL